MPNEILIPMVEELLVQGKKVTLPLRGFSMRPYLEDNRDKALLSSVQENLKVGDVILAETAPKRWALHRIVRICGDNITMCGDGNLTPEYIERKDVRALAIGFYRKGSTRLCSVDTWHYRLYWRTWMKLKPLRRYLLLLWLLMHHPIIAFYRILRFILRQIGLLNVARRIKKILCK